MEHSNLYYSYEYTFSGVSEIAQWYFWIDQKLIEVVYNSWKINRVEIKIQ